MTPRLRRITVDLTPIEPGGANGGAKPLARTLVRELAALAPEIEFLLLTSAASHAELADLDAPNVRRQCVDVDHIPTSVDEPALASARAVARLAVNSLVPPAARTRIKDGAWTLLKRRRRQQVIEAQSADLLFCPFTAPFFFDPAVPVVSIVHDLQFLDLPDLFDPDKRNSRELHFRDACLRADRVICVSDFVRQSVLAHSEIPPDAVQTIHSIALHSPARDTQASAIAASELRRIGIAESKRFLLYPANAWPHKNHRRLVEALALHLRKHPASDLALVCTGAPSTAFEELQAFAEQSLPDGTFGFGGFLDEREFSALLRCCRALIFPSLYEGFGLPVLEAMAFGRPVLCSNATSLPEIAADAAVLFDPHEVASIAGAIGQLEDDPSLEAELLRHGYTRLKWFGSGRDIAARYLESFEDVVRRRASRVGSASSR